MRRLILTLITLLTSLSIAQARDITTLTGQTYRTVTVTRIEKLGIGITHQDGFAFLDFSVLPAELRREFGYTEDGYATALTTQKRQQDLAVEIQRRLAAEAAAQQSEALRQREAAQAADALAAAQRAVEAAKVQAATTTIATRDYSSRGYGSRDYGTTRYSPPTTTSVPTPSIRSSGGQCAATTKKGYRCSRSASPGSATCYQH